jgi:hypothetical protein
VKFESNLGSGLGSTHPFHPVLAIDTASHVIAGDSFNGVCGRASIFAHPHTGAIALIDASDVKVGEQRVRVDHLRCRRR